MKSKVNSKIWRPRPQNSMKTLALLSFAIMINYSSAQKLVEVYDTMHVTNPTTHSNVAEI